MHRIGHDEGPGSHLDVRSIAIAAICVVTTQSVYVKLSDQWIAELAAVVLVGLFLSGISKFVPKSIVAFAIFEVALVLLLVFAHITLSGYVLSGEYISVALLLLVLVPAAAFHFANIGNFSKFLPSIVTVMNVEAAISLFFYVFGQSLSLISPTRRVVVNWGGPTVYDSYFDLFYVRSSASYGILSHGRNIGIFAEAPMHAFMLLVSLLIQLFILRRVRAILLLLTLITIVSTYSTTGMILAITAVVLRLAFGRKLSVRMTVLLTIAPGALMMMLRIYSEKSTFASHSVEIRNENWGAAMDSFLTNPLIGWGFKAASSDVAVLGHTSTVSQVLADGGVVLLIFYFGSLAMLIVELAKSSSIFGMAFVAIVTVAQFFTVVSYTGFSVTLVAFYFVWALSARSRWFDPELREFGVSGPALR